MQSSLHSAWQRWQPWRLLHITSGVGANDLCHLCPIAIQNKATAYCPFLHREILADRACRFSAQYLTEFHRGLGELIKQLRGGA